MNSTTTGASNNSTMGSGTDGIWEADEIEIWIFSISLLFGPPTHSYVIWLIVTGSGRGVASEFFQLNLFCCEICFCVDFLFFILSKYISSLLPLALLIQGFGMTGRPLFQCLICVERYLAVVHPVTFLKYKPLRYRVICCTVAWITTLASCLVCLIIYLLFTVTVHAWFFLMQFLLFCSIQLFCLMAVLRALKQSGPGEKWRKREREEENHMKKRAFHLILITTATLVITYMPITFSVILTILTQHDSLPFWSPSLICYILGSFVQPLHYLHQAGKISCLCSP
ncbi:G-protein coupled receptor 35-like [Rhinichthys klamathensis goyatoka]|uniref:G-protein coupled receptor 35-like n=1 Tax=Rhinichthys klamathensis goyatoka TaxID=3034132 RepID=UPI0024B4C98A|nr:G-protein coupled receptor 35-like [Rhinichthys klamathensis goyatoka]